MGAPTAIRLRRKSRVLELEYAEGKTFRLPCEYLRVFSPSAEVRGHGGGELKLVPGKRNVNIERVDPVGQYAVRLVFDDGHDSGLFTWAVLENLGENHEANWAHYVDRLQQNAMSRDSDVTKLSALGPAPGKWKPG